MLIEVNSQKVDMNNRLRSELVARQDLLGRVINIAQVLWTYGVDISSLDSEQTGVRLWRIDPGHSHTEELPTEEVEPDFPDVEESPTEEDETEGVEPELPDVEEPPTEEVEPELPEEWESANVSIDGGYPTVGSPDRHSCTESKLGSLMLLRAKNWVPVNLRDRSSSNDSRVRSARRTTIRVPSHARSKSQQVGRTYCEMFPSEMLPSREELVPGRVARDHGMALETSSVGPCERAPKGVYPEGRIDAPRKPA